MNSLNSVLLEGNLTQEPETRFTNTGKMICYFTVASDRYFNKEKEVSFFEIETWQGLAEKCANELRKGSGVRVVGRLKQKRWKNAEKKDISKVIIVAEHIEIKFKPSA
jgi:single-strand DNA-binding protein